MIKSIIHSVIDNAMVKKIVKGLEILKKIHLNSQYLHNLIAIVERKIISNCDVI